MIPSTALLSTKAPSCGTVRRLHSNTPPMMLQTLAVAAILVLLPPAGAAQTVLRQGSNAPPGTVYHRAWIDFKTALERDAKAGIKVDLNTNEPNEANLLSNLRRGRTDCAGVSLQGAATIVPEIAVLQLPYLFTTLKEVDHVYGQPQMTETFSRLFAAKGVHMLSWVEVGFTNLYGVAPIRTPADVKGQKFRATQSRASQHWMRATGAEAVVLPIAELLPGLQTGLVKGGESGVIVYDALINKTAPHYTLTQHAFDSGVVLCNKEWFDKLRPEQARAVNAAWDTPALIRNVRAQIEKIIADAPGRGVTVHRLSETELKPWREIGKKAAEDIMATLPPEAKALRESLVKQVQAAPR